MKNIYQLYEENGCDCPFIVQRESWGNTAFVVTSIGGRSFGSLTGTPPYYDNARVEGYLVDSFSGIEIKERGHNPVSCAGSYQWKIIKIKGL